MLNPRLTASRTHCSDTVARRLLIAFLMLCLTLILSSCASVAPRQDKQTPLAIPAAWSNTSAANAATNAAPGQATSLAQWWTRFDDPQLSQLVARAIRTNTEVNRAQAALRQARALRDVTAAGLRPTLGSAASASHGTAGGNSTGNLFKAGLDAAWEPDIFGGKQSALDAGEATREISLRLAIGALEHEVLLQFLIEAVVLSALGGVIGILIATAASWGLSSLMGVPYAFDVPINLLSLAFAAGIGVLFGYFPARCAVRMDPIEALRHE